jgi:hypothetical protein
VVEALVDVEVVLHLGTVVAALGVGAVVVADGREDRRARDGEAVGLEEAGVPVVVLSPALLVHASLLTPVDVVAERQDEADVVVTDEPFEHVGDAPLAAAGLRVGPHPDPEVAHGHEADRRRGIVRVRPRTEPQVVAPPGRGEVVAAALTGDPVPQLPRGPLLTVDLDAVAVVSLGLETLHPHPRAFVGGGLARNLSVCREDLDGRVAERLGRRPDARAAAHPAWELLVVDDLPAAALRALEVERAPRDQGSVAREIDEVDKGLAVNLGGAHVPSMPSRSVPETMESYTGEPAERPIQRGGDALERARGELNRSPTVTDVKAANRTDRRDTAAPHVQLSPGAPT